MKFILPRVLLLGSAAPRALAWQVHLQGGVSPGAGVAVAHEQQSVVIDAAEAEPLQEEEDGDITRTASGGSLTADITKANADHDKQEGQEGTTPTRTKPGSRAAFLQERPSAWGFLTRKKEQKAETCFFQNQQQSVSRDLIKLFDAKKQRIAVTDRLFYKVSTPSSEEGQQKNPAAQPQTSVDVKVLSAGRVYVTSGEVNRRDHLPAFADFEVTKKSTPPGKKVRILAVTHNLAGKTLSETGDATWLSALVRGRNMGPFKGEDDKKIYTQPLHDVLVFTLQETLPLSTSLLKSGLWDAKSLAMLTYKAATLPRQQSTVMPAKETDLDWSTSALQDVRKSNLDVLNKFVSSKPVGGAEYEFDARYQQHYGAQSMYVFVRKEAGREGVKMGENEALSFCDQNDRRPCKLQKYRYTKGAMSMRIGLNAGNRADDQLTLQLIGAHFPTGETEKSKMLRKRVYKGIARYATESANPASVPDLVLLAGDVNARLDETRATGCQQNLEKRFEWRIGPLAAVQPEDDLVQELATLGRVAREYDDVDKEEPNGWRELTMVPNIFEPDADTFVTKMVQKREPVEKRLPLEVESEKGQNTGGTTKAVYIGDFPSYAFDPNRGSQEGERQGS